MRCTLCSERVPRKVLIMSHRNVASARVCSLAAAICILATGCAPTVKSAAREASKTAVDQSAQQLKDPETKETLQETAEDPRVAEATAKMSEQVAEGVVRSLASPETSQQLSEVSVAAADAASQRLIDNLGTRQSRAVFASLASAASEEALSAAQRHVRGELGPALREVLKEDIVRGVAEGVADPRVQESITQAAEAAGMGAVSGVQTGLSAALSSDDARAPSALLAASRTGTRWLLLAVVLMGLAALALLGIALMVWGQARRSRLEVARLESTALLLASAVQRDSKDGDTREIVAAVRESMEQTTQQRLRGRHSLFHRPMQH